jgi:glucose-6-phosphate dehydrogenase assembly protein OpcA
MAPAVAARVARASTPDAVETDLSRLWRDVAGEGPVARAVMSNLVVCWKDEGGPASPFEDRRAALVDEVAARHPSRVIAVAHDPGSRELCAPTTAAVAIVTFGPPKSRYAVEEIAIRCACAEAALPSIVRRFVRGDLPTSTWWTEDISRLPPIASIVAMGRQLVYDSRRWSDMAAGVRAVAPFIAPIGERRRIDLADLNWRRLAALRQALVFASKDARDPWQPSNVRIAHRPDEASLAWLLIGWLTARLGWAARAPIVVQQTGGDEVLSVTIRENATEMTATLDGRRAMVTRGNGVPAVFGVPRQGEADAVAAELRTLSHDVCLHDALSALVQAFSAA